MDINVQNLQDSDYNMENPTIVQNDFNQAQSSIFSANIASTPGNENPKINLSILQQNVDFVKKKPA